MSETIIKIEHVSKEYRLGANNNGNNLHSGPDNYHLRIWKVLSHTSDAITLELISPSGDQGFPGKAVIRVTYRLSSDGGLHIVYDGICDRDTVFNLTNHSYFNLAGHQHTERAMEQTLTMPARFFTVGDEALIPTGENRDVAGTPFDFREPKTIGRDFLADNEDLKIAGGYDHCFCFAGGETKEPVLRVEVYEPNSSNKSKA